jgi:hypothetical protein
VIGAHQLIRPLYESSPGLWTEWDDNNLIFSLIAGRRLEGASLITREFPISEAAEAYRVVCQSADALTVLFDWER